jgi:hypothetical protein
MNGKATDRTIRIPNHGRGKVFFSYPKRPDLLWCYTGPLVQMVPGTLSSKVKRLGRETHLWPSAEVKKSVEPYLHPPPHYMLSRPAHGQLYHCIYKQMETHAMWTILVQWKFVTANSWRETGVFKDAVIHLPKLPYRLFILVEFMH